MDLRFLTRLRGFQDKLLYLLLFSLNPSLFGDLRDKRSLGAMSEFWPIERDLLQNRIKITLTKSCNFPHDHSKGPPLNAKIQQKQVRWNGVKRNIKPNVTGRSVCSSVIAENRFYVLTVFRPFIQHPDSYLYTAVIWVVTRHSSPSSVDRGRSVTWRAR